MLEGGGLRLGMVVFDHEEGKRRLELLSEFRRGVRDPLGIAGVGGHLAERLFPAVRSNMRPQPDRYLWVPAIVEYACERKLREDGSLARAEATVQGAVEVIEKRAWEEIAECSGNSRYRFRPRPRSYTWFASLPHHAYLPTLRRMGFIRESTARRLVRSLAEENLEDELEDSRTAAAESTLTSGFRRAVDRRKEWLAAIFRKSSSIAYPKVTAAERRLLGEIFIWYGSSTHRPSLMAWCIRKRVSVYQALNPRPSRTLNLDEWHGDRRLRGSELHELILAASAYRICAAILEAWLEPRLGARRLKVRVPPRPKTFGVEQRALHSSIETLRKYVSAFAHQQQAMHAGAEGAAKYSDEQSATAEVSERRGLERSFGALDEIAAATQLGWERLQHHLYSSVVLRKGSNRTFHRNGRPESDEEQAQSDDSVWGLNSWLANEIVEGLGT